MSRADKIRANAAGGLLVGLAAYSWLGLILTVGALVLSMMGVV